MTAKPKKKKPAKAPFGRTATMATLRKQRDEWKGKYQSANSQYATQRQRAAEFERKFKNLMETVDKSSWKDELLRTVIFAVYPHGDMVPTALNEETATQAVRKVVNGYAEKTVSPPVEVREIMVGSRAHMLDLAELLGKLRNLTPEEREGLSCEAVRQRLSDEIEITLLTLRAVQEKLREKAL